jgi:hypothetical protein
METLHNLIFRRIWLLPRPRHDITFFPRRSGHLYIPETVFTTVYWKIYFFKRLIKFCLLLNMCSRCLSLLLFVAAPDREWILKFHVSQVEILLLEWSLQSVPKLNNSTQHVVN